MVKGVNILVVEDDSEARDFLVGTLKEAGYHPWPVTNGKEVLKLIQETSFAVCLTELRMAPMNGIEILRKLKKLSPHTSVVVITAYSFIESAVEAMEQGAFGYITKPFNIREINVVIRRAVEKYFLLGESWEKSKYRNLSITDGLTGVFNHRHFHELLLLEIARLRRYSAPVSLLMVDIDHFKKYNDTYGHVAGDGLLRGVAQTMLKSIRNLDVVCRYGGEEFVVILSQANKEQALLVCQRLMRLIRTRLPVTISVGLTSAPEDTSSKDELIEMADEALYQAKHLGRDRICYRLNGEIQQLA